MKEDLWNLVTYSKKDVTIIQHDNKKEYWGNKDFLNVEELNEILSYVKEIKKAFQG